MDRYLHRELSWLDFNARVLAQAKTEDVPIGERCRFLSITQSNADEFQMVRVASLARDIRRHKTGSVLGRSPRLQMKDVRAKLRALMRDQQMTAAQLLAELSELGVRLLHFHELSSDQQQELRGQVQEEYLPHLMPILIQKGRRLPHMSSKRLHLAMRTGEKAWTYSIPLEWPRFLSVPGTETEWVPMEEVILTCLLPDEGAQGVLLFRILRDEDLDFDDQAPDFLSEMERSVRRRGWGVPVAMEYAREFPREGYDPVLEEALRIALSLERNAVTGLPVMLNPKPFTELTKGLGKDAFFPKAAPVIHENLRRGVSMFEAMRKGDFMVHVPYEAYDPVLRLLQEAAEDPNVMSIRQTLYRVSSHSPVVEALGRAARAGKTVTVMVELKARFDEEHNIHWAHVLEHMGCQVIYGLAGLKVHGKALLITRRGEKGVERYLHLGTGNYNEDTARAYSDMHLFTCREDLCKDAEELFKALSAQEEMPVLRKLKLSPNGMRPFLYEKIDREIENAKAGRPSGIRAKVNSLSDIGIIDRLYEASRAGVPVELVTRGICCLLPGVEGMSENIRVVSIVGRYLEHHRIFAFEADGAKEIYLSSADWMPRNLDRRVEIAFPVEDPVCAERLHRLLSIALADNVQGWELHSDGTWSRVKQGDSPRVDFQSYCAEEMNLFQS